MPTDGALAIGLGSVWVIDRKNGELAAGGTPRGSLYRVDPRTNGVIDQIHGVVGASITFADGDVWIGAPALNRVLRVTPTTHVITPVATGPSGDEYPASLVATPRGVWVGNHHGGTVVRIDPQSNQVAGVVRWSEPQLGGPQRLASDGQKVWAVSSRDKSVLEIDAAADHETRRISTKSAGTCGGISVGTRAVWVASGYDLPYACWVRSHWGLVKVPRDGTAIKVIDIGGERPFDVREALGAVWVLTDFPHTDLFKVDANDGRVLGRLRLNDYPNYNDALTAGFGALWVRLVTGVTLDHNGVRTPPTADNTGVLLRIQPNT